MTYRECLDYLFSQLPMYQRVGKAAYKADLDTTIALCALLGNPENTFKSIHIAGTNGKGSVAHMLASILQESGLKVGLYTSPHMIDFRERVRINGKMISEEEVVKFVTKYRSGVEKIEPSFFEWTMALAFDFFARQKVDIAVVETGMGGRLDSTNVLKPLLSIITNIGSDHKQFLGSTRAAISGEKAGIIKLNTPVVIGESDEETSPVFLKKAEQEKAEVFFATDSEDRPYGLDLKGPYQHLNRRTVLTAVRVLIEKVGMKISEEDIQFGLSEVRRNTGLKGRWEWLGNEPPVLADAGHNLEGIQLTMNEVRKMPYQRLFVVWGMVADKEIDDILKVLPKYATYFFCRPEIPRGLDAEELAKYSATAGLKGGVYPSVREALAAAKKMALNEDLIFVGGSTFVVAEVV